MLESIRRQSIISETEAKQNLNKTIIKAIQEVSADEENNDNQSISGNNNKSNLKSMQSQTKTFERNKILKLLSEENFNYLEKKRIALQKKIKKEAFKIKFDLVITMLSMLVNLVFFVLYAIETFYNKLEITQEPLKTYIFWEFVLNFFFIFEYTINFLRYPGNKLRYFLSLFALIDKISIISTFLNYYITATSSNLNFIRVMRFLKFAKRLRTVTNMTNLINRISSNKEIYANINPIKMQIIQMSSTMFVYFLIGSGVTLTIQDFFENSFSAHDMNFLDSIYFTIISSTSVGYGDIFPTGKFSRTIVVFSIIFFIYIISDQIGKMINILRIWGPGIIRFHKTQHIVIFSSCLADIADFVRKIRQKESETHILIVSEKEIGISSLEESDRDQARISLIIANAQEENFAHRTNIEQAKLIFIFSNYENFSESKNYNGMNNNNNNDEDDFENNNNNNCKSSGKNSNRKNFENLLYMQMIKLNQYCRDVPVYIFSINLDYFCFKFPNEAHMEKHIESLACKKLSLLAFTENKAKIKAKYVNNYKNKIGVSLREENYDLNDYSTIKKFFSLRKLKNLILAKASVNPGFLPFMQNLLFNPKQRLPPLELCFKKQKDSMLESYHESTFNELFLCEVPHSYLNCRFIDFVKSVYFSSAYDYERINSANSFWGNNDENNIYKYPILAIGVVVRKKFILQKFESPDKFLLFPINHVLKKDCMIVCITHKFENNKELVFAKKRKAENAEEGKSYGFSPSESWSYTSEFYFSGDSVRGEFNELNSKFADKLNDEAVLENGLDNENCDLRKQVLEDKNIYRTIVSDKNKNYFFNNKEEEMIIDLVDLDHEIPKENNVNYKISLENSLKLNETDKKHPLENHYFSKRNNPFEIINNSNNFNLNLSINKNNDNLNNDFISDNISQFEILNNKIKTKSKPEESKKDFSTSNSILKKTQNSAINLNQFNLKTKFTKNENEGISDVRKSNISSNRKLINVINELNHDYHKKKRLENNILSKHSNKEISQKFLNVLKKKIISKKSSHNFSYNNYKKQLSKSLIYKNNVTNIFNRCLNSSRNKGTLGEGISNEVTDSVLNLSNVKIDLKENAKKNDLINADFISEETENHYKQKLSKTFYREKPKRNNLSAFYNITENDLIESLLNKNNNFDNQYKKDKEENKINNIKGIKNNNYKDQESERKNELKQFEEKEKLKNASLFNLYDKNLKVIDSDNSLNSIEKENKIKKINKLNTSKSLEIKNKNREGEEEEENELRFEIINDNSKNKKHGDYNNYNNDVTNKNKRYRKSKNLKQNKTSFIDLALKEILKNSSKLKFYLLESSIKDLLISYEFNHQMDQRVNLKTLIDDVLLKYYAHCLNRNSLLSFEKYFDGGRKSNFSNLNQLKIKPEEIEKLKNLDFKSSKKLLSELIRSSKIIINNKTNNENPSPSCNERISSKRETGFSNKNNNSSNFKINTRKKNLIKEIKARIINLHNSQSIQLHFSNHILIFGFDTLDSELINKLFLHFSDTSILIIGDLNLSKDAVIKKNLSLYSNLFFIVMDSLDPFYLKKLNLEKVSKCFLLMKSFDKRVMADMRNLQLINFFNYNYNFETFIEQNSEEGNSLLGFTPKIDKNSTLKDPFYHPLYMSGKILYISKIKEICSESFLNENLTDAWLSLVYCGFPNQNYFQKGLDLNLNVVTVDVPEFYFGKEYVQIVKDLFLGEVSCLPLGLYVASPLELCKKQEVEDKDKKMSFGNGNLKVNLESSSFVNEKGKRRSVFDSTNKSQKDLEEMINYMKMIKENSLNGNLYLDEVYMFCIPTSIFITNPKPNLIISPGSKIMLLVDNKKSDLKIEIPKTKEENSKDHFFEKEIYFDKERERKTQIEKKKKDFDAMLNSVRKQYHQILEKNFKL